MAAPHDKAFYEKAIFTYFVVCEGLVVLAVVLSNDITSGWPGTPYVRGDAVRTGGVFKTRDFVNRLVGGATVERL